MKYIMYNYSPVVHDHAVTMSALYIIQFKQINDENEL